MSIIGTLQQEIVTRKLGAPLSFSKLNPLAFFYLNTGGLLIEDTWNYLYRYVTNLHYYIRNFPF